MINTIIKSATSSKSVKYITISILVIGAVLAALLISDCKGNKPSTENITQDTVTNVIPGKVVNLPVESILQNMDSSALKNLQQQLSYIEKQYQQKDREAKKLRATIDKMQEKLAQIGSDTAALKAHIADLTALLEESNTNNNSCLESLAEARKRNLIDTAPRIYGSIDSTDNYSIDYEMEVNGTLNRFMYTIDVKQKVVTVTKTKTEYAVRPWSADIYAGLLIDNNTVDPLIEIGLTRQWKWIGLGLKTGVTRNADAGVISGKLNIPFGQSK